MHKKTSCLFVVIAGLLAVNFRAAAQGSGPFAYTNGNVMVGFRQTGATYDFEATLGPIATIKAVQPGHTMTFTNVSAALLTPLFGANLEGINFSISCRTDPGDPLYQNGDNVIWVTRLRSSLATQSTPWKRQPDITQGTTAGKIDSIGVGAVGYSHGTLGGSLSSTNQPGYVVVADGYTSSYNTLMGTAGKVGGTFQGNIETSTPLGFANGSTSVYSDFYELFPTDTIPGSTNNAPGTFLGYFTLTPAGVLSFTAAGGATPPNPVTLSVTRANSLSSIQFTSQTGYMYTLYFTNSAGLTAPRASWPALAPVAGTGSTLTITDSTTDAVRFYVVGGQ